MCHSDEQNPDESCKNFRQEYYKDSSLVPRSE